MNLALKFLPCVFTTLLLSGCGDEVKPSALITEDEATRTFMTGYAQHTLRRIADAEAAGDEERRSILAEEAQAISATVKVNDCKVVESEASLLSACMITASSADGSSVNLKTLFEKDLQSGRWLIIAATK